MKKLGHDLKDIFDQLPNDIKEQIKIEYAKVNKESQFEYFDKGTSFDEALIKSRRSFEECRYFFDKFNKSSSVFIYFYFLSLFAASMHIYVLENTDFDLQKTKNDIKKSKTKTI